MTQQISEDWVAACLDACAGMPEEELQDFSGGTLKHHLADTEELLKAVYVALLDVDYLGRYEQGIYALKKQNAELLAALIEANEEINLLRICDQGGDAHVGDYNDLIAKAKAGVVK